MAKHDNLFDPDYKTRGDKDIIQARTTYCQIKKLAPKLNKKRWNV
jgi:hypothetical protein